MLMTPTRGGKRYLTSIHEALVSSIGLSNDTGLADKRVSQGRLAVIDVSDHRHVANVRTLVHDHADLVYSEVHHSSVALQ
jgi:hypothetical protein